MSSIVPRTRWAVRGPGAIARRFAGQLPHSQGLEVQLTDGDIAWLDLRVQQR